MKMLISLKKACFCLFLVFLIILKFNAKAETIIVDSNIGHSAPVAGAVTLHEAINLANSDPDKDTIVFNLAPEDKEIKLTTQLSDIYEPVTFLGKTYNDTTVLLNDSTSGSGVTGLQFLAGSKYSQVQGMSFQGFETALHIKNTSNITLTDNNIGAIVRGNDPNHIDSARISNRGIHIESSDSITIGGDYMTKGNTITNCSNAGIYIKFTKNSYIYGNKIGKSTRNLSDTSVTNSTGIEIERGVSTVETKIGSRNNNNLGNVISGNTNDGIKIVTSGSTINIIIANNYIGTDRQAMKKIGNENGISLIDNSFALGTKYNIFNNIIAYNQNNGIDVRDFNIRSNISENSFYCNGSQAIAGESNLPSRPVINKAGKDRISGTEFSETIIDTIEVYYEDTTCSGESSQGQHFLGKTISNNGDWQLNGNFTIGKKVVALLIDDDPKTSPFTEPLCIKEPVNAGPDQFIYIDSTTIQASEFNEDSTGNWQFDTSNTGISIQNMDSLNTLVKNIPDDTVINVKWCNQDTGICKSCDSFNITHLDGMPPDSAKVNNKTREICSKGGIDSIMVSGNHPPKEDTGKWKIIKNSESATIKKTGAFRNYKVKVVFNKADTVELSYTWDGTADTMTIINQNGLKVVNNKNFGACGSFERALDIANDNPDLDTISFGKDIKPITLSFSNSDISEPVVIDGYSHPDYKADTPAVKIKSKGFEVDINAENVTIRGLTFIEPDKESYIDVNRKKARIVNNYLGYDPETDTIYNNRNSGINISDSSLVKGNTIAGFNTTDSEGKTDAGISVEGRGNVIENNVAFRNNMGITIASDNGNLITKNTFYCNRFKGIHLVSGGNDDHVSPTITDISNTQIQGKAVPQDSVELYYADTLCNTKQGKSYFATVKAGNSGNWQYNGSLSTLKVVALGYDTLGNTSEFSTSPCIAKKPSSVIEGKDFAEITPADSTGNWENVDNNGKLFTLDSLNTAYHVDLTPGKKRLVWHDSLTKCPNQEVATDTVSYQISPSNSTGVDAGEDVSVCFTDTADITGGSTGTLQWIPLTKGLTFSDSTKNSTTVYNLNKGPNYIIYNKETYDPALGKNVFKPDLKIVYRVDDSLKVYSVNDAGCGSLRNAVDFAEKQPSKDTITFTSNMHSDLIRLDSLIAIDSSYTVINGDIDNDNTPDIKIENHNSDDTLFKITGNYNTIKNLNVRHTYAGFKVKGIHNKFIGNYIGTDLQGSGFYGSDIKNGIILDTSQNEIGNGTKEGANRFARCNKTGILINSDSNTVDKNYIGGIITGSENLDFGNTVGIKIQGDHNKISNNDIAENGYETSGKYGIGIFGGDHNMVEKNNIVNNRDKGIFVDSGSNEQAIKNQFHLNNFKNNIKIAGNNQQGVKAPFIDSVYNDTVVGNAAKDDFVQLYASDRSGNINSFVDSVKAGVNGKWKIGYNKDSLPEGLHFFTALRDSLSNTSEFSDIKFIHKLDAGNDTIVCDSTTQLKATKTPEGLSGRWIIPDTDKKNKVKIEKDSNHITKVNGLPQGKTRFIWVLEKNNNINIISGPEPGPEPFPDPYPEPGPEPGPEPEPSLNIVASDTVVIKYQTVTKASLPDSNIVTCQNKYLATFDSLNADKLSIGEKIQWKILSGTSDIDVEDIVKEKYLFSGLEKGINKNELTIFDSTNVCTSTDTLSLQYNGIPVTQDDTLNIKADKNISLSILSKQELNTNNALVIDTILNERTYRDTAYIEDKTIQYRANRAVNRTDTLIYRVCDSICNSNCNTDSVIIKITDQLPDAITGKDTTVCSPENVFISALDTASGWSGTWSSLSKAAVADPDEATTAVNNLEEGINLFEWKLTEIPGNKNAVSFTDTIAVYYFNPVANIKETDSTICQANESITLKADSIDIFEKGSWTPKYPQTSFIKSSDSNVTDITGMSVDKLNTFYWKVADTSGTCSDKDSVSIAFSSAGKLENRRDTVVVNDTLDLKVIYRKKLLKGDTVKITPEKTPEKGNWVFGPQNKSFQYFPDPENIGNDTLRFIVNKNSCPADINRYIITIKNVPPAIEENKDTANKKVFVKVNDINKNYKYKDGISFKILKPDSANKKGIFIKNSGDTLVTIDYSAYKNFDKKDTLNIEYEVCDTNNSCQRRSARISLSNISDPEEENEFGDKAPDIEAYNAVSPNGDGVQDFFKIKNIAFYNNKGSNKVIIFNRWGAEVYRSTNYLNNTSNAFTGRTNDNKELPGGTYYYHITVSYKGNTKKLSGYLELKRK